jgi:hypothetical protein
MTAEYDLCALERERAHFCRSFACGKIRLAALAFDEERFDVISGYEGPSRTPPPPKAAS